MNAPASHLEDVAVLRRMLEAAHASMVSWADRAREAEQKLELFVEEVTNEHIELGELRERVKSMSTRLGILEMQRGPIDEVFAAERRRSIELLTEAYAQVERLQRELAELRLEAQRLRGLLGGVA